MAGDGYDGGNRIAGGGGSGRTKYYDGANYGTSCSAGNGRDGGGAGGSLSGGSSGAANTGGGGGGAGGAQGTNGGSGGSGIVYLKYTSETQLVNWTGTASDHTVTSYDQSVAGGTKRTWIHKITGDGALSLL